MSSRLLPAVALATGLATLLAACATARLSNDLRPYVGRDIHELIAHIGKAHGEQETNDSRVFVWSSTSEGYLPTSADGNVATRPMAMEYECTLEVTVDVRNVIQSYQVEGSNAGCNTLRHRLR